MAGSPKKRLKRAAETQRASSRAKRFSAADRVRALQRAGEIGTAAAAIEFGVSASTLRTWRRRLSTATQAAVVARGEPAAAEQPVVVPDGPLDVVASAEARARDAAAAAEEILVQLRAASARGDANAARAFGSAYAASADRAARAAEQVLDLRERHGGVTLADGERLVEIVNSWMRALGVPWAAGGSARRLFGELVRREIRDADPDADTSDGLATDAALARLGDAARAELARFYATQLAAAAVAPSGEDPDALDAEDGVRGDSDAEHDLPRLPAPSSPTGAEGAADADDEPPELVELAAVPAAFRARFELGDAGSERARRAYSERLRDERRRQEAGA